VFGGGARVGGFQGTGLPAAALLPDGTPVRTAPVIAKWAIAVTRDAMAPLAGNQLLDVRFVPPVPGPTFGRPPE
jgi:hypothetical protein